MHAEVRADGVVGGGIGVGISGVARARHLVGTVGSTPTTHRFEVGEEGTKVVLVLELKARAGTAWFDAGPLRLTREVVAPPSATTRP